ncbi:hypothetical protein TcCL_NonESM09021 [Trypanosoma cruzi]|nr:hypothetical protein TcCL_NonESM09021 [Trypanosoma cruzi]
MKKCGDGTQTRGDKGPHRLCGRLTLRRPVCNHDAALHFVSLQETGKWREGGERRCGPHPSRLDGTPVTSSRQVTRSNDCRIQQRSVPSSSNWGISPTTQSHASSPTTQRGSNSGRCDTCNEHAAENSHCSQHDQKKQGCIEHFIQILGRHTLLKGGRKTCQHNRQFHFCL